MITEKQMDKNWEQMKEALKRVDQLKAEASEILDFFIKNGPQQENIMGSVMATRSLQILASACVVNIEWAEQIFTSIQKIYEILLNHYNENDFSLEDKSNMIQGIQLCQEHLDILKEFKAS